jgi:succinyl-CoA synthetase beta subunit
VVLYSVQKLAQVLDVDPSTVCASLKKGKRGRAGGVMKLQAYYE